MTRGSTVLSYVVMQHCPKRIGDDQNMPTGGRDTRVKAYPDGPDGHHALHITFALGHRPDTGLATTACGGKGPLEDLVAVVDVEEKVGETEDWDYGAHLVGLTTVVSPMKIPMYACRNRVGKLEEGCIEVVVVGREKKMVDETYTDGVAYTRRVGSCSVLFTSP